jgi:signal transduction histidine kinase
MRPAPIRLELRLRQADASWRYTLHSASPRFDQHGTLLGWIGSAIDLEERRIMENNLRTLATDLSLAHRQKDEFLATLAHELRNPLAPMRNSVELMRRLQPAAPVAIVKAREILERQLSQLVRLVDDLLDVSRITSGKLELRRERASIEDILQRAIETSRPYIDGAAHTVTLSLPETPLVVDGDVTRLSQVFSNLLNNAAKYSDRARTIHLSALREGAIVVRVRDEGVGIAPDKLSHVFDLFMQVDHTLERSQGGLGIGLTLVKRLVELHGGSVDALSEGVGHGSEFTVRLPLEDARIIAARDDALPSSRAPSHKRILVADDNLDAANSLAALLRLEGHDVQLANDGLEALEAAESTCPDVIFLDIGMPQLNGYETCERIRAHPWSRHTILIALTGWGQLDDRRKSAAAGFDHHVVKPVDPAALPALLRS